MRTSEQQGQFFVGVISGSAAAACERFGGRGGYMVWSAQF
jgi:hypothetical protein